MKKEKIAKDIEWEQRVLCIDTSCIGVIGPDQRCKECGKPYDKKAVKDEDLHSRPDSNEESAEEERADEECANDYEKDSKDAVNWEDRTLCSDGNCIGVIGPDGRCKECGK